MVSQNLETIIVNAFCGLNPLLLNNLPDNVYYSYNEKSELIEELSKLFGELKNKGFKKLRAKQSKCEYCYPNATTYSFHELLSDVFVVRYVIHQVSEKEFRIEQCRNKPIPDGDDGMPF